MKQLIFILMLIPVLALGQNRFITEFQKANAVFNSLQGSISIDTSVCIAIPSGRNNYNPSVYYDHSEKIFSDITDAIFSKDSDLVTIIVSQVLQVYWMGYVDGSVNSLQKGKFDANDLERKILSNKRSIKSYIRFLNALKHTN
ncbi:MAG: hypothetical protein AB2L24_21940 [Mangrovibacterium sp.]